VPYKEAWRRLLSAKLSTYRRYVRAKRALYDTLGGKCARCGTSDMVVLTIHHKGEGNAPKWDKKRRKHTNLTWLRARYFEELLSHTSELELMCHNCHAREHHRDPEEVVKELQAKLRKPKPKPLYRKVYELILAGKNMEEITGELKISKDAVYRAISYARARGLTLPRLEWGTLTGRGRISYGRKGHGTDHQ